MDLNVKIVPYIVGLCHNNLNQTPDEKFPTTSEDLQGFWDMLLLQVDHVDSIFAEIEELKKNNWQVSFALCILFNSIHLMHGYGMVETLFESIMDYAPLILSVH